MIAYKQNPIQHLPNEYRAGIVSNLFPVGTLPMWGQTRPQKPCCIQDC